MTIFLPDQFEYTYKITTVSHMFLQKAQCTVKRGYEKFAKQDLSQGKDSSPDSALSIT